MANHRPVRLTAHDDPDNRYFCIHDSSKFTTFVGNSIKKAFTITKPDKGDVKGLARVRKDTFHTSSKSWAEFCLYGLLMVLK